MTDCLLLSNGMIVLHGKTESTFDNCVIQAGQLALETTQRVTVRLRRCTVSMFLALLALGAR
jgi:hypothetical protein